MTEPYRPSSGTEGATFMARWCENCKRDAAYRADPDRGKGCPIIADSMAFRIDDPGYPVELVQDENGPKCTAFEDIDAPARVERCAHTVDMFDVT